MLQNCTADSFASVRGQNRHAPNPAAFQQAGGPDYLVLFIKGHGEYGASVMRIPFFGRVDSLFLDKNTASNGIDTSLVRPVRRCFYPVVHAIKVSIR